MLAGLGVQACEQFEYTTFDGQRLEGWLMRPAGWQAGQSYPAVLNVHGGPHGMHGYVYNALFQALCGAGYAVVLLNPRGSNGCACSAHHPTTRPYPCVHSRVAMTD